MTICSGFPHGSPYGFARANEYFSSPFAMRGNDHMLGLPTRKPLRFARANEYFSSPFAMRRGDRVGRPLCAEGPPKRHCQFESKGAQRHLSPSRTHQTKGCTKFTENPHRYRPIYTHNSAGRPRGDPYGLLAQTNIFHRRLRCVEMTIYSGFPRGSPYGVARANEYFSSPFAIRRGDRVGRPPELMMYSLLHE